MKLFPGFQFRIAVSVGVFCSILFVLPVIHAADYYVDADSGNDSFSGTSFASAWKTLDKINMITLNAGDNVYLKRGATWREPLVVTESGTEAQPIYIGTHPDDDAGLPDPVVSCAREVSGQFWQGILANGGFEILDQASGNLHRACNCGPNDPASNCVDTPETFANWTNGGAGTINISQDTAVNAGNDNPPYGAAAKLESTSTFVTMRSLAMTLPALTGDQSPVQYNISGYLMADAGSRVEIALYATAPVRMHLDASGNWVPSDPSRDVFFVTTGTGQWEPFDISFTGISDDSSGTLTWIDVQTLFISVSTFGPTANTRGWVDDIRMTRADTDYWTVNSFDTHNSKIFVEDGNRLATPVAEWNERDRWHGYGPSHAVRYIPPAGTAPADHLLELGQHRAGIKLDETRYVEVDNVTVTGCEAHMQNSTCDGAGFLLVNGASYNRLNGVYANNNDHGIRVEGLASDGGLSTGNLFTGFEVANSRSQGIALRNNTLNNTIANCKVHDLGMLAGDDAGQDQEPISLGGGTGNIVGTRVENCEVYNVTLHAESDSGVGIVAFKAPDTVIRHNYVHDIGRNGIVLAAGSSNSEISYNVVDGVGKAPGAKKGSGIVVGTSGINIDNVKVLNNTIHDCRNDNKIYGGLTLEANASCYGTACGGSEPVWYTNTNLTVNNNIVFGCTGTYPMAFYAADIDFNTLISDNNIIYRDPAQPGGLILFQGPDYVNPQTGAKYTNWSSFAAYQGDTRNIARGLDQNSISADPQFVDRQTGDFQLSSNSPAVDIGIDVGPVPNQAILGLPDAGGLELGTRAAAEFPGYGTVAGSFIDTRISDNNLQSIQEEILEYPGRRNNSSQLEHTWRFDIAGAVATGIIFHVEAHHSENNEGDDFVFAYSTDGVNYTDMLSVTKTVDDDTVQSFALPPVTASALHVQVRDADRNKKSTQLDTLYIDQMYLQAGTP